MVHSWLVLQHMKREELQLMFLNGFQKIVFNVINVLYVCPHACN